MHKILISKAFKRAEEIEKKRGIKMPSNTSIAKLLSDYIEEKVHFHFGERRLRDYYNLALKNDGDDINIVQQKVILGLCKYLGYQDYQHFLKENITDNKKENPNPKNPNIIRVIDKNKITISSIIIALLISFLGYDLTKKDCMVWDNDHYKMIRCDERSSSIPKVVYNEVIFNNLKKVTPNCEYPFYKPDGSENLWYGKSIKGDLEYFTYHGLHPLTGETLHPITKYMIEKHICNQ